jgi:hypothetical protein
MRKRRCGRQWPAERRSNCPFELHPRANAGGWIQTSSNLWLTLPFELYPRHKCRVPHISLVFREMWDTAGLPLKPVSCSTLSRPPMPGCPILRVLCEGWDSQIPPPPHPGDGLCVEILPVSDLSRAFVTHFYTPLPLPHDRTCNGEAT